MNSVKREILRVVDAAVAPRPAKTTANAQAHERPAYVCANHRLCALLLAEAGEPNKNDKRKLLELDAPWLAEWANLDRFNHEAALAAWRADRDAFMAGKRQEVPAVKQEYIRRFSEIRALHRERAAAISRKAAEIAKAAYQRALDHLPALREKFKAQEEAMFPGVAAMGETPLQRMLNDLPRFIAREIESLEHANRRPSTMLPSINKES